MIDKIKTRFGKKCSSVKINPELFKVHNVPRKKMKFCEALHYSFNVPLEIHVENISCPGAKRSFGFKDENSLLLESMKENKNISKIYLQGIIEKIPVLNKNTRKIILGMTEEMEKDIIPDFYIIYSEPADIMKTIHELAGIELMPEISPFTLLSICGNVLTKGVLEKQLTISFGCPEARISGNIEKNEAVMGIPYELACQLFKIS